MNPTTTAALAARLDTALIYAGRGWPVIPLIPGSKRPACPTHPAASCDRSDPHCRHGHAGWEQRATTARNRITRAWSSTPYGIGIATGPAGLLVVDTDTPKPGDPVPEAWRAVEGATGEDVLLDLAHRHRAQLPPTYTVATPSGGQHRYYRAPAGVQLGNTAGRLGWLVDTRGAGGYVVAPPTATDAGAYRVLEDGPPAPLPGWLTQLLTQPSRGPERVPAGPQRPAEPPAGIRRPSGYVAAAVAGETARVRMASPGTRNATLFTAALALGQLVAAGQLDRGTARLELLAAAAGHLTAGAYPAGQAEATIRSGLSRGATQPRTTTPRRTAA